MYEQIVSLYLVLLLTISWSPQVHPRTEAGKSAKGSSKHTLTAKDIYKAGFEIKRTEQLNAVKRMLALPGYEKQYSIVEIVLKKLFSMLADAKIKTVQSGYIPGGDFPEKRQDQEALGLVFENIAFFGDILLRMPKITHELLKPRKEWRLIVEWGLSFCVESGIFTGANEKLLHLVAQELELVPRDPNYVNPYKETPMKGLKEQQEVKQTKKKVKKEGKKRSRGPRLSRTDL